jgi:hypothetical protein
MVRVLGACGPRGVDELVVQPLLDVRDNPVLIIVSVVDDLAQSDGFFKNQLLAVHGDGGRYVGSEQLDYSLDLDIIEHALQI